MMTTVAAPIMDNQGKVLAVAGIDLGLQGMQEMVENVQPFQEQGCIFLTSSEQKLAAHPVQDMINTEVAPYFDHPDQVRSAMQAKELYMDDKEAVGGQGEFSRFYLVPFQLETRET
ncbi:MAG: cache domain-containing protein [Desulfohalobiaceae bacterium]